MCLRLLFEVITLLGSSHGCCFAHQSSAWRQKVLGSKKDVTLKVQRVRMCVYVCAFVWLVLSSGQPWLVSFWQHVSLPPFENSAKPFICSGKVCVCSSVCVCVGDFTRVCVSKSHAKPQTSAQGSQPIKSQHRSGCLALTNIWVLN